MIFVQALRLLSVALEDLWPKDTPDTHQVLQQETGNRSRLMFRP